MADPILIAKGHKELFLLPKMANRHGLIAGATGTGKTVTLQRQAEAFSRIGVPTFMSDVKGDLSGISQPGGEKQKIKERVTSLGLKDFHYAGCPVTFWDVFGNDGHPVRATVADMGPLLFSRILNLNDIQTGVLTLTFKIADDHGLPLLDLKDLRAMIQYVGENAKKYTNDYGNISSATIGAIQRGLVELEQQGGAKFLGEPALDLTDLLKTDAKGQGVVNLLAADKLLLSPTLYATFLLWMLTKLYEKLPEVGDLEKPKLVFFFDEAHLLFNNAPQVLEDKIEQVVRLIRSKGVGVYFVTQNPIDIPEKVLGQLGNRIQHALRAFSPRDQKAVKSAAETFRQNPKLDVTATITQLGVGEALVSMLDEQGSPAIVERAFIVPPGGQIGPITPQQRINLIKASPFFGHYERSIDRESAYEILKGEPAANPDQNGAERPKTAEEKKAEFKKNRGELPAGKPGAAPKAGMFAKIFQTFSTTLARVFASGLSRKLLAIVMAGFLGDDKKGRRKKDS
jgi:DNA helicase HerA-like ATPase